MSKYESPELLQVGAVQEVVLGAKGGGDDDSPVPFNSKSPASILDID